MLDNVVRFLSLSDANVRFVLLGSLLIGATGGLLGSFAVLRKRSLVGDALAHAALPGVALAYLAILLKGQGKYDEALKYLKMASADRDGKDPTILEHLGDCLEKLKQKKQAVESWKQALELARKDKRPDKKLIERIEKKLKDAGETVKPSGK